MEQLEQDEYELCMHNDDDDQEVLERFVTMSILGYIII